MPDRVGMRPSLVAERLETIEADAPPERFGSPARLAIVDLSPAASNASDRTGQTLVASGGTGLLAQTGGAAAADTQAHAPRDIDSTGECRGCRLAPLGTGFSSADAAQAS